LVIGLTLLALILMAFSRLPLPVVLLALLHRAFCGTPIVFSISFGGFPTMLPDVRAFVVTMHEIGLWSYGADISSRHRMAGSRIGTSRTSSPWRRRSRVQTCPNDGTHWMEGVGLAGALAASTATFAPPCAIYFAAFRLMRRF
jgi:hypothetical protein